jgi:2-C-methyl-D-erythritol 4-phosphate cytidylyltransferase
MLSAILVAAGNSRRMGFDKLFAEIAGKPVIAHSIAAFEQCASVSEIIIVAREDGHRRIEKLRTAKVRAIVTGGEHRHDSVRAGLDQVGTAEKYVAVHDAARPLITPEQIESVYQKACKSGAATLAEPIADTVKRADVDLIVTESVDRHRLYAMQTPQIFEKRLLQEAYRGVAAKRISVTDEVSAVVLLRHKVSLVLNERLNLKITYPRDLRLAEFVLQQGKP